MKMYYYLLTISSLLMIPTTLKSSKWQSQTRIWRIGTDEGIYRIPVGGGITKTKEWIDGIPQTLQFSMKIPDDVFNGWGFINNIMKRNERVYQIRAYLGVGQVTCLIDKPSYGVLQQLANGNPNIKPIGPHGQRYVGGMSGIGAPIQSFAARIQDIQDIDAKEAKAEYQEACIFIVCQRDPDHSRGWPSRTFDDKHYCPIQLSFSWRTSALQTDSPNIVDPNKQTDKARHVYILFWSCAIFDIIMLSFIGFATIKICSNLSEFEEEAEFYY